MTIPTWVTTTAAVVAAAGAGSLATDPKSAWYRTLRKPSWQPPPAAFPAVWTPLYGLIAVAGARALDRSPDPASRRAFGRVFATDLGLNAAWTLLFFGAKRPKVALAEILALNVANVLLWRRAANTDRLAGAALAPYVAWCLFATALNSEIVRLNRRVSG
ncbi:tryptophan-rich sensory protein [Actinoplanes octamycinicus]|uniref:Tryptophan-rich sensory protein n=1 Tax=Actinoplanes octamycinicus TaxID=135948 RepID=A0A7W7GZM8_9ACTN|nr:TspO/MBR family protein [Actinoplanes octamycinicus]MBB4741194.1 tryptophan-rich sensory protein [Actinoplanes octamycinicus]GIE56100.1 tryptophan-rich sensory protein [Actinoplanes octamycinicus]